MFWIGEGGAAAVKSKAPATVRGRYICCSITPCRNGKPRHACALYRIAETGFSVACGGGVEPNTYALPSWGQRCCAPCRRRRVASPLGRAKARPYISGAGCLDIRTCAPTYFGGRLGWRLRRGLLRLAGLDGGGLRLGRCAEFRERLGCLTNGRLLALRVRE